MTTPDVVTEHIRQLVAYGQRVYDRDGAKLGTVEVFDNQTGWVTVEKGAFLHRSLYIPYRLIATIDEREIGLSVTKDDLLAAYTNPPARTTVVKATEDPSSGEAEHIALTHVPSGYTGAPLQVDHTNVDQIMRKIEVGMRVFDVLGERVGTIDTYNVDRRYLGVRKNPFIPRDLYVPMALVDGVDLVTRDVHLAVTKDHLKRVHVTIGQDGGDTAATIVAPDN